MATDNGNLFQAVREAVRLRLDAPALILPDGTERSFGELLASTGAFTGCLLELGLEPGDRALVQVDKSEAAVAFYLACLQAGVVYIPLNPAYTPAEVAYFLEDAEPALFVCQPGDEHALSGITGDIPVRTLGMDGTGTLAAASAAATPVDAVATRRGDDLAAILYTSGTTGRSKGAMLSHTNLASNAATLLDYWGWRPDDVLLHALPIFHVHGLFVAMHCAFLSATPMIFLPKFDARAILGSLPRATVLMGVPTFYSRLLEQRELDATACGKMRLFISGSAPLTEQAFAAWERRTGHRILERYGMSETLMNTSNPLTGERRAGTVGFALPGVDVRICSDEGDILGCDEVGVIEVRGPNVFSGYWRMPEKTAEEFRTGGWFITGDLGVMDADGRVSIVGRAKDMVISGGFNVYPKEVERLIDAMEEVEESAVIGVPHPDFGEGVVAVVVPVGADVSQLAVDEALAGELARFKQPKRVVNRDALPRNAMGKVQKNDLREELKSLFLVDGSADEGRGC